MIFDAEQALFEALDQSDLRPLQKLRVRLAVRFRPAVRAEVLGAVQMQCCLAGYITEEGEIQAAVDWQQIIDMIVKYLPTILSIVMLFV